MASRKAARLGSGSGETPASRRETGSRREYDPLGRIRGRSRGVGVDRAPCHLSQLSTCHNIKAGKAGPGRQVVAYTMKQLSSLLRSLVWRSIAVVACTILVLAAEFLYFLEVRAGYETVLQVNAATIVVGLTLLLSVIATTIYRHYRKPRQT